jgi:hypothetical protein
MSALSDAAETLVVNFLANTETATRPTAWYLALFSAAPSDSGGGTELSGSGYARQNVTFGAGSSGVVENTSTHTFTASGGNWAEATHYAFFSASSGGTMWWHGALTTPKQIDDGDSITVAAGAFTLTGA